MAEVTLTFKYDEGDWKISEGDEDDAVECIVDAIVRLFHDSLVNIRQVAEDGRLEFYLYERNAEDDEWHGCGDADGCCPHDEED